MPEQENNTNSTKTTTIERRIKKNQMERSLRRMKMFIAYIKAIFAFCCALALCFGLYKFSLLSGWYLKPNIFDTIENNPQIELEGNSVTSDYQILSALRTIKLSDKPIYLIDTDEIEKSISQLAPINKAYVRRFAFPARFVIRVEERVPVITVSPSEKMKPVAFFTSCGQLIGREYLPLPKEYHTYLLLSYGTKGDDYHNWDATKVNSIVSLAKEIEKLSGEKIVYIDWRNPKDIYIKLKSALVRIGEVDETVHHRIRNIGILLTKIAELKNKKIKYIDLRWETSYLKLDKNIPIMVEKPKIPQPKVEKKYKDKREKQSKNNELPKSNEQQKQK